MLLVALLLVILATSTRQVKAYGNSMVTINCPIFHFKGYSDSPYFDSTIGPYGILDMTDRNTGTHLTATLRMTRGSGTFYTFDAYFNLLTAGPVYSRDYVDVSVRDSNVYLMYFRASIDSSPLLCGAGNTAKTIPIQPLKPKFMTCAVVPLNMPGGIGVPAYHLIPGNVRYVDTDHVRDYHGTLYVAVQVDANVVGFIPPSCVGGDAPVPIL